MEKEQAGKTEDAARSDEERRLVQAYERRKTTVDPRRDGWFAPANIQARHDRERRVLRLLDRYGFVPLKNVKVFEVGCGSGYWLREFIKWGVQPENIAGVDLLPDRVASAVRSCPQGVSVRCGSAAQLDVPDESYDIVLQSLLFSSVLGDDMRQRIGREMLRILKPSGMILWYDLRMNNPYNRDVRGVKRAELERLFPGCRLALWRLELAPPLSRRLAGYSTLLCDVLGKVPWLCTHYLGVIRKR